MPENDYKYITKVWHPDEQSNNAQNVPQNASNQVTPDQFRVLSQNRQKSLESLRNQYNEGSD